MISGLDQWEDGFLSEDEANDIRAAATQQQQQPFRKGHQR